MYIFVCVWWGIEDMRLSNLFAFKLQIVSLVNTNLQSGNVDLQNCLKITQTNITEHLCFLV